MRLKANKIAMQRDVECNDCGRELKNTRMISDANTSLVDVICRIFYVIRMIHNN